MASPGIPCLACEPHKDSHLLGFGGRRFRHALGSVAGRTPSPNHRRKYSWQPQLPAGPSWWSLSHHPISVSTELAPGLGWSLPASPSMGTPPPPPHPR